MGKARTGVRTVLALLAAGALGACCARAGTVNPGGPILYFDSFEKSAPYWDAGKNTNEKAARPQTSSRKLDVAPWDKDKKTVWTQLRVSQMNLKLTGAVAEQVFVGFQLSCDDAKEVHVGLNDGYTFSENAASADQWVAVACSLSQCTKNHKHPPKDLEIKEISVSVVSKSGKTPTAYIDDFILTAGVRPEAAWGSAIAAEGDRMKRVADPQTVGFLFNDDMETALETALRKAATRPEAGTVLAVALGKNAGAFANAVKEQEPRKNVSGFKEPDGLKLSSVGDLRLFLPYGMGKGGGELVLIAPSAKAMQGANAADAAMITQRCLAVGAVPIWILPTLPNGAKEDAVKRLNGANKALSKEVAKLGAASVDAKFALKDVSQAFDGDEPNAAGYQAIAKLVHAAMAHVERYVRGR
ncbi:MAG: hypothetical protein NTW87_18600 [Planctomycetota bacterium]|nr:hypothetical protein [Planctomycetota bacterium]